jgi:hypothetical protein
MIAQFCPPRTQTAARNEYEQCFPFLTEPATHELFNKPMRPPKFLPLLSSIACVGTLILVGCVSSAPHSGLQPLQPALTFYAPFDGSPNAAFGRGDQILYSAATMNQPRTGKPGLPESRVVTLATGEGRFGDALQFHKKSPEMVFFKASQNVPYRAKHWAGTVSFWLRLSPDEDLEPGFTDPIQITPRQWNDAAFFVEFGKDEKPRHFRLGAYADFKVWNPENRDWGAIPFEEKPLISVTQPPFKRTKWTHVVFTFSDFNTSKKNGVARLYLDGRLHGEMANREQTFSWDTAETRIMLGLSYVGYFDELAIFDRELSPEEVRLVYESDDGLRSLVQRTSDSSERR